MHSPVRLSAFVYVKKIATCLRFLLTGGAVNGHCLTFLWTGIMSTGHRTRCRLGCGLGWARGTMYWMGVQISPWKWAIIRGLEALGQCMSPPRHVLPVSRSGSGSPPKFNNLFIGPFPTFPENLMQIRSEVFLRKVANRQTNRQTDIQRNKQRRLHILLGSGNYRNYNITEFCP